ncbi:MAG: Tenacibaculum phage pT24, partial [Bacteroidota bacterium]
NAFGNSDFNFSGRTQIYSEGYVYNTKLKPIIISSTTTIEVRPFDSEYDAYGVINGKVIPISPDTNDYLALNNILVPNAHRAYVIVLTEKGIQFRLGSIHPLDQNIFLPQINVQKEIVLGYYELGQDGLGNYFTNFFPITIDENGFINPFRQGLETTPKISFNPTSYDWIQELYFEEAYNPNPQDYNQLRIYHLWYWLSQNLEQDKSLVIDTNGNKQPVQWVEQGNDGSGRWVRVAVKDHTSNIYDTAGTSGMVAYYMQDIEFLAKNKKWDYNKPPLEFGTKGIIGYESFIKDSYLKGFINSGDPFFWSFSEEVNVTFTYAEDIQQNLILIPEGPFSDLYYQKKVIIEGSQFNDGIWHFLDVTTYKGIPAIIVQEDVTQEDVDLISIYDADYPYIINLYDKSGYTTALVEVWDGNPEELYQRLKKTKDPNAVWAKTLEIIRVQKDNELIVNWNRYAASLDKGFFLLSNRIPLTDDRREVSRNWTRIVDLQRLNDTELLVVTDSPVRWRLVDDVLETDILRPIWEWVDTFDFKILEGFKPREDVFPDGTDERMNKILNLVAEGTKMQSALTTDRLEWRYLIDSFGGGLEGESKMQLAQLAAKKQFALSFINVPSIKAMKKDGTKYTTNGKFDTQKFIGGGDRKNNTGSGYSLAPIGSTHAVYLAPWVSVYENGRHNIVPPASHIGQLFMRKHNDNKLKIWDALAGTPTSNITSISGLEERFSDEELNDLHQFGITCLKNFNTVLTSSVSYIFNEKTAVREDSVLRFTHNREALIEIELSLYKGLRELQWNFIITANEKTKEDVEKVANDICEYYRLNDAIQDYTNEFVIDNELIDAQIGLLNTNVELNGVMQTILLKVSILKTGGISILFG